MPECHLLTIARGFQLLRPYFTTEESLTQPVLFARTDSSKRKATIMDESGELLPHPGSSLTTKPAEDDGRGGWRAALLIIGNLE
jgi:hypothetical protein